MKRSVAMVFGLFLALVNGNSADAQLGSQMTGVGAINRSMGGASTAAPLDTLGAFLWNPATISALPNSADMSVELLMPQSRLSSSVAPGAFGPGTPPVGLSGSTNSDGGAFPLPDFGFVYQPGTASFLGLEDVPVSFGIGVLTVNGFASNFPGSTTNPILTPPPPNGLGVGPMNAQYVMTQIVPTMSVQLSDQVSLGFSPIVDLSNLNLDPGFLTAPNAAGGGYPTYPPLNHNAYQWGAGFQMGVFYKTLNYWQFGASFKSPQWCQDFQYNTQNQIGVGQSVRVSVNAPLMVSLGAAYTGIERTLFALDLRYLDFANTAPLNSTGLAPNGTVMGLGWNSIFGLSTGTQYELTDALTLRAGYSFNTNPIANKNTFFNAPTPLDIQHGIYFGGSYKVTDRWRLSLAYAHFFANTISGPWYTAAGGATVAIPGTNISATSSADSVIGSASFFF